MIIGLAGPAGVGKTTVAKELERTAGFVRRSFATPLKTLLARTAARLLAGADARKQKALAVRFYEEMADPEKKRRWRTGMQWFGTDIMRAEDHDFWVRAMERDIRWDAECRRSQGLPAVSCVIDDVRFPNEMDWIFEQEGLVFQLSRQDLLYSGQHSSERPLIDYSGHFSPLALPNDGSPEETAARILKIAFPAPLNL